MFHKTDWALCLYIVIRYPQQMVQMAFCDLPHTFHKQVTNVSQHVFVILLWGILTSPLIFSIGFMREKLVVAIASQYSLVRAKTHILYKPHELLHLWVIPVH